MSKFRTEHAGVRCVIQKGLHFWTEQLVGCNKSIVIDFYKYMKLPEGDWENDPNVRIISRVGDFNVEITPDDIAEYLKIIRPPPESVNYPRKNEMIDVQVVNEA